MILAGLVALLAGIFLLVVEVKDPIQLIAIALVVIGAAIVLDLGRGYVNR